MLFYQALIMVAVVVAIYLVAFIFKFKNRKVLVISIIAFIAAGGVGLYAIQYTFGNHYYTQKIDAGILEGVSLTSAQEKDISKIFSGYGKVSTTAHSPEAFGKAYSISGIGRVYKVSGNGADSTINVNIFTFPDQRAAGNYFNASQKFYENKSYIPLDTKSSKKKGAGERYLVSFIKSQYKDFSDIIYLPSKITYSSDVVIEYKNVIFVISETANKPVTNKASVINDIKGKLALSRG